MAENNYQANNGQPPFRRYEPPTNMGTPNSQVAPLTPPPLSSFREGAPVSRGAKRRQRQARNRWRQWIQSSSAKQSPATSRSSAAANRPESPAARSGSPRSGNNGARRIQTPMPAASNTSRTVPGPATAATTPASYSPEATNFRQQPGGAPPAGAPGAPSRSRSNRSQRSRNNVTPLRQQPVWSSPEDSAGNAAKGRRAKPRRGTRRAPQPVLYGIRLLILGTGIAAIAGTILSSLNPSEEMARNDAVGITASETNNRTNQAEALSQPLPLADELVSVETDLVALESMTPGLTQSVFFYDLDTGNYIDLNGTEPFAAASTIKVSILVAFLQAVDAGAVDLNQAVTLREDLVAGGSGELQTLEVGSQVTALEAATAMIIDSDNTATNMVIELLGGIQALNQQFVDWGLESTTLRNLLPDLDGTNTTSSADLVRVMALVDQGNLLSQRSRDRLFSIMQRTYNRSLIPEGLADESALAYNKTGDIGTLLGDIALVDTLSGNRYILSVLVDRPFNDGRASELIRRVSGRLYEEMSQPVSPVGSGFPPASDSESAPETSTDGTASPAPESENYDEPAPEVYEAPEPYVDPGMPLSDPALPPG